MKVWQISVLAIPLLAGCEQPRFEFRAYTDLSNCRDVIDAELGIGSEFLGSFDSDDFEAPGTITELSGELFSQPVRIDIACSDRGDVRTVRYLSSVSEPLPASDLFVQWGEELVTLYGEPEYRYSDITRSLMFLCDAPSPIRLDEWVIVSEDDASDEEPAEHEVYLAITPSSASCLDDE